MKRLRQKAVPWLFLAPSLGGVVWFTGLPFLDVVRRSFQDAMGIRFTGLDNYRAVLGNSAFRLAAGNTVRFLAICIPLLMTLSFGAALLISAGPHVVRRKGKPDRGSALDNSFDSAFAADFSPGVPGPHLRAFPVDLKRVFRISLTLPMAIPAAGMALVWRILLCPDGVLNQVLSKISGQAWQVDWAFSRWAFPVLTATYLWKNTGYDMILWLAGLQGIPGELYEAAKMDGAGASARMWYITIPCLKGTFGLVGILSVVNAFRAYREAYLLAGSYPDSSIYLIPHLFAHWFLNLDVQKMTAAAVMMTAVALFLAVVAWARAGHRER